MPWSATMNVEAVEPDIDGGVLLAGAQFSDAYSIATDDAALDARRTAEKMLARGPRWIDMLHQASSTPSGYFRWRAKRPSASLPTSCCGKRPTEHAVPAQRAWTPPGARALLVSAAALTGFTHDIVRRSVFLVPQSL
jgi:hypothetical protein